MSDSEFSNVEGQKAGNDYHPISCKEKMDQRRLRRVQRYKRLKKGKLNLFIIIG